MKNFSQNTCFFYKYPLPIVFTIGFFVLLQFT